MRQSEALFGPDGDPTRGVPCSVSGGAGGSCEYTTADLLALVSSAGKVTLMKPSTCLIEPRSCHKGLQHASVVVIHYHGGASTETISKMVRSGASFSLT